MKRALQIGNGRGWFLLLAALAVGYGLLDGLRTVSDPDIFWQLATGRWVAQHHQVFSSDVFSYTAQGRPWIYPVGSGLLLYAAYRIGGYVLLTWIGAAACVATIALLLRRGSATAAAIAIVAVPVIAGRTGPRADMFTVVLFAAYFAILWQDYETGKSQLWLLPLLMAAWVNLHPGFVAGLGLILVFLALQLGTIVFDDAHRTEGLTRLKRASPWYLLTALATLANPWGWGIYSALLRQDRAMALHAGWISEWGKVPLNPIAVSTIFQPRNPTSTYYLLLAIAAIAVLRAIWQGKPGAALLLAGALYMGVEHVRLFALAAGVVVVVGGAMLSPQPVQTRCRLGATFSAWQSESPMRTSKVFTLKLRSALAASVAALLAMLVCFRSYDVVSNRNYVPWTSGAGLGWQFPESAAAFIEREDVPGEVFNTYNVGGYLTWRLGPKRRDYVDGRALPFGGEIFGRESELLHSSLDSALWQQEADRYNINSIVLPLNRFDGASAVLPRFCESTQWRPVYLDEVAAVFVRRTPRMQGLIQHFPVDCSTSPLPAGTIVASTAGAFNQWANAAAVLTALGRYSEAMAASEKAGRIIPDNAFVPWVRANIYSAMHFGPEAERQYRNALALARSESLVWFALANLYQREGRTQETILAQRRALSLSFSPQPIEWLKLARLYLDNRQPKEALATFDQAVRKAPPDLLAMAGEHSFRYNVAIGRATAWRALGNNQRASAFEDESVRDLVPANNPKP